MALPVIRLGLAAGWVKGSEIEAHLRPGSCLRAASPCTGLGFFPPKPPPVSRRSWKGGLPFLTLALREAFLAPAALFFGTRRASHAILSRDGPGCGALYGCLEHLRAVPRPPLPRRPHRCADRYASHGRGPCLWRGSGVRLF